MIYVRVKWGNNMILYLTSTIGGYQKVNGKAVYTKMNNDNHFVDNLKSELKSIENISFAFFCSSPGNYEKTDMYSQAVRKSFELDGFTFSNFYVIDYRFNQNIEDVVNSCDIVFLCGGHVSTQNKFLKDIELGNILSNYDGIVIGQSAGSMNMAATVYDQPVTVEEFHDSNFKKQYSGLGLTDISIMPHMNMAKDEILEGMTTYEMCILDSESIPHYGLVDFAFIKIKDGVSTAHGRTTLFRNGEEYLLIDNGESCVINDTYEFDLSKYEKLYSKE